MRRRKPKGKRSDRDELDSEENQGSVPGDCRSSEDENGSVPAPDEIKGARSRDRHGAPIPQPTREKRTTIERLRCLKWRGSSGNKTKDLDDFLLWVFCKTGGPA
ncbi:hypothetical protein KFL_000580170 [Klebsormidium nitens]|uniref:Uncharacterized protein n=1 Tax=Klebsormidium nitens TaxID=105231 RepID=A0A1Y1HRA4_KLENI|nr:hypothetical protein KFL_000580170 [Klebsormidium nitens]|eukprot:GAQ80623.1 hypothetical protein KFL_000580170 [Klebsormidium nitens]